MSRKIKVIVKSFLLSFLFMFSAFGLEGLKVGEKVPDVTLKTLEGKSIKVHGEENSMVLLFYRGSWCPYCMKQLKKVNSELVGELDSFGARLLAISVDRPTVAKKMRDKFDFQFPIVSDPKAESLKAFNIVNKLSDKLVEKYKSSYNIDVEGDSGETHHMVAHPAVFIVKDGEVVFADVHTNYKKRTDNQKILDALEDL